MNIIDVCMNDLESLGDIERIILTTFISLENPYNVIRLIDNSQPICFLCDDQIFKVSFSSNEKKINNNTLTTLSCIFGSPCDEFWALNHFDYRRWMYFLVWPKHVVTKLRNI